MWLHTRFSPISKGQIIPLLPQVFPSIEKEGKLFFKQSKGNVEAKCWQILYQKKRKKEKQALTSCMTNSVKFCNKI